MPTEGMSGVWRSLESQEGVRSVPWESHLGGEIKETLPPAEHRMRQPGLWAQHCGEFAVCLQDSSCFL